MLDDKIKQRLRALFNTAENDASAEGEIDNALRAAKIMMDLHQVSRDDVFQDEAGEFNLENVEYNDTERYSMYTSLCQWENLVCHFIIGFVPTCNFYMKRGVVVRNQFGRPLKGKKTRITFYGPELDAVFCGELFDEVSVFIQTVAKLRYGTALARGDAASYAEGFASGLYYANNKEVQKISQHSDATALVVVEQSKAIRKAAKGWLTEKGIRVRKGGRGPASAGANNIDAYSQGKTDGKGYQPGSTKKAGLLK